jgi:hypothetical protein
MADIAPARPRGRRLTLEIPEALYARLLITKVQVRRTLGALAEEGIELVVARYSAARRGGEATPLSETPGAETISKKDD